LTNNDAQNAHAYSFNFINGTNIGNVGVMGMGITPLQTGQYAMYGYEITDNVMPVAFYVSSQGFVPAQQSNSTGIVDLDMTITLAASPISNFLFPANNQVNNVGNSAAETFVYARTNPAYQGSPQYVIQTIIASPTTPLTGYTVFARSGTGTDVFGFSFGLGMFALTGGIVIISLCIISTLICFCRRHRQARRLRRWQLEHPNRAPPMELMPRLPLINYGASDEEVAKLPTAKFSHDYIPDEDNQKPACAICLNEYEDGDPLIELPCKHYFHQHCGKTWLKRQNRCPLCVRSITRAAAGQSTGDSDNPNDATATGMAAVSQPLQRDSTVNTTVEMTTMGSPHISSVAASDMQMTPMESQRRVHVNDMDSDNIGITTENLHTPTTASPSAADVHHDFHNMNHPSADTAINIKNQTVS